MHKKVVNFEKISLGSISWNKYGISWTEESICHCNQSDKEERGMPGEISICLVAICLNIERTNGHVEVWVEVL